MKKLIFIFVIVLAISIVIKTPVALFIKDGRLGPAMIYGAEGTIWSGRASLIRLDKIDIHTPKWSLKPLYLFLAKAKAHIEFTYLNGRGQSNISVNLNKTIQISELDYTVSADELTQEFASGLVGLEGDLNLQVDELNHKIGEKFVTQATGFLSWQKSAVSYPVSGSFGNIFININQNDDTNIIQADIGNKGGEVSVKGKATINEELKYQANMTLKPNSGMSEALGATLQSTMRKKADGSYSFQRSGSL